MIAAVTLDTGAPHMPLAPISNILSKLPYATLIALQAAYNQAAIDLATVGQSHAVTGRTFTLVDQAKVIQTLAEIQSALDTQNGTRIRRTLGYGGGFTR